MSKQGMIIARAYGKTLPRFPGLAEAERELFHTRDYLLNSLKHASYTSAKLQLDESPNSLKELETWYFKLLEEGKIDSTGLTRDTLEHAISMYFGAVVVANIPAFKWVVLEYALESGRYEIGIRKPLFTMGLAGRSNLELLPNNKRRQSLFRKFCQHAKY